MKLEVREASLTSILHANPRMSDAANAPRFRARNTLTSSVVSPANYVCLCVTHARTHTHGFTRTCMHEKQTLLSRV